MDIFGILKMKKNKIIKKGNLTLLLIVFGIVLAINAFAIGVSSPYWDENPLYMQPGEVKEFRYLLQNMVGDKDIKIKAEIESGTTIMSFVDENNIYNVPLGKSDIPVNMKIIVPNDAKKGDEYQVGARFTTLSTDANGPLTINTAYSKGFRVIVGEKVSPEIAKTVSGKATKPIISTQLTGFLISLVILIILLFIIKYFYKHKEHKK